MSKSSKTLIKTVMALALCAMLAAGFSAAAAALSPAMIEVDRAGSIVIEPKDGDVIVGGGVFSVYRVAEMAPDSTGYHYKLVGSFLAAEDAGFDINRVRTAREIEAAVAVLQPYLGAATPVSDRKPSGTVVDGLAVGIYLVVNDSMPSPYAPTASFLVFMPMPGIDDETGAEKWEYDIAAYPKLDPPVTPPPLPQPSPQPSPLPSPPPSPPGEDVEIGDPDVPRDGLTPPPSPPGEDVEIGDPDVPRDGLTPPGEDVEIEDPDVPLSDAPQTGMLQWPIPVLSVCGSAFIIGGIALNWKKNNKKG